MPYLYVKHSVGKYRVKQDLYRGGVTLHFEDADTGELFFAVFNCETEYARKTGKHKKGDSLPHGHFRVSKLMGFYKFWVSCGLKPPDKLSKFHRYMGHLKSLEFDFDFKPETNKVFNESIRVLNKKVPQSSPSLSQNQPQEVPNIAPSDPTYLEALDKLPEAQALLEVEEIDGHFSCEPVAHDNKFTRISEQRYKNHLSCSGFTGTPKTHKTETYSEFLAALDD